MTRYRGLYRGPGFLLKHFVKDGVRHRCVGVRDDYFSQEEIDEAIRAAKQFDAVVGWTRTKEGV